MTTAGTLLALLLCAGAAGQSPLPRGEEVLDRLAAGFEGIEDYTVSMDVVADIDRLKVPPMKVTMYWKRPDRVHFDAEGFALLPREGVALNPETLRTRFTPTAVSRDTLDGREVLRVTLKPKSDRTGLREFFLDVDPSRWTPERMVTPLFDGRTMTATLTHGRVEGRWLPSALVVRFTSTVVDTAAEGQAEAATPAVRPATPRRGTVTVRYSGYRLNGGLSDDLFSEEERPDRK